MLERWQLNSLSYDKASLFGLPHIGAEYKGMSKAYRRVAEYCPICGRRATTCHHVVPRSVRDTFRLYVNKERLTADGIRPDRDHFDLRSPLFALCGSGTSGCHNGFHGGARYVARWEWEEQRYFNQWWDGLLLTLYAPHSPILYDFGWWEITDRRTRKTITYREEPW